MFCRDALLTIAAALMLVSCGGNVPPATPDAGTPVILPTPASDSHPVQNIPEQLSILVIGQSISSNCNEFVYGPVDNVFQIGKDGAVKEARDPFEWADCDKGSMWMPLGRVMIEQKMAKKVIFMPIGLGSTMVKDWQPGGRGYVKLNSVIDLANKVGLKFDMVLWHQGTSDIGTPKDEYVARLNSVIDYVNSKINTRMWFIGIHSQCYGRYDPDLEAAQRAVAGAHDKGIYLGANNNSLGNEYRFDECHLNHNGQEKMALLWAEAIRSVKTVK